MKPSEMGLHSRTRYVIMLKSCERRTREDEIIQFTKGLYDFIFDYISTDKCTHLEYTQKFARFVSKIFTFAGYEDSEIYTILLKNAEIERKSRGKS